MLIMPTIVDKITTLKDGSLKIVLETSELEDDVVSILMSMRNRQVFCALKNTKLKPDELDIKEMPVEFKNDKSQSQRLRSVLYVFWEQNRPTTDFETFYKRKTDEFIDLIKGKLN